jgi:hypothetical protein
MKSILFKVILTSLANVFLLAFVISNSINAQNKTDKPLRILIDASKDGGLWWFPQVYPFDVEQNHQGKAFADSLRREGAEVIELPRGEIITLEKLREADVVIRVPAFFSYTTDEVIAYRESVAAGTRLLLIGSNTQNYDPIAESFGLRFEKYTHFASVQKWKKHPFTADIGECCELTWLSIVKAPKEAVFLASLNQSKEIPVLGYLPYGRGYVVFIGQALFFRRPDHSLSRNLIDALGHYSLGELQQLLATEVLLAEEPEGIAPRLIEPLHNSTFPQPGVSEWRFDWEDIPGAENYEIVILGPSASIPLTAVIIDKSEFTLSSRKSEDQVGARNGSYIAVHNLLGWSWKVRAQYNNGKRGPWSSERRFNISPRSQ